MFTWTELSREVSLATRNGPLNMVMMIFNWEKKKKKLGFDWCHIMVPLFPFSEEVSILYVEEESSMNTRAGGGYLAVHWHKLSCFCNLKFVGCWLHFKQKSNLFFLISANIWTFTIILSSNILKYELNTCSQPLMTEHTHKKEPKFLQRLAPGERQSEKKTKHNNNKKIPTNKQKQNEKEQEKKRLEKDFCPPLSLLPALVMFPVKTTLSLFQTAWSIYEHTVSRIFR